MVAGQALLHTHLAAATAVRRSAPGLVTTTCYCTAVCHHMQRLPLKEGIASFYDESSQLWESMWVSYQRRGAAFLASSVVAFQLRACCWRLRPSESAILLVGMLGVFAAPVEHWSVSCAAPLPTAASASHADRASTCTTATTPRVEPPRATSRRR